MFGDKLSKSDCIGLIRALSSCKTPFQCAHGRPVMAVIMEIQTERRDYQVSVTMTYSALLINLFIPPQVNVQHFKIQVYIL